MLKITGSWLKAPTASNPLTETGTVAVKDGNVFYKKIFLKDKLTEIPLVVLHGGPAVPHNYLLSLGGIASERPVIFYDQLGCGESDKPPLENDLCQPSRFVEELETVLSSLGVTDFHLYGHSWGAAIAIKYTLEKTPPGLRSLILASPLISVPQWAKDSSNLVSKLPEEVKNAIITNEAKDCFDSEEYKIAAKKYMDQYLCRLDPWPEPLCYALENVNTSLRIKMWGTKGPRFPNGILKGFDQFERLCEIKISTLITCGRYDSAAPETLLLCQKVMKQATLKIFEKSSHMPHLEEAESYLMVLRNFFNKISIEEKKKSIPKKASS